ncbi:MAG: nitroreductase [Actinomycetota bacterium]|nr:nitroreductase [Actinomycetota bacterium]
METYEAIMTRRSVPKLSDRVPERQAIQRLLDAAVRAPTHHLTQPWRFVVLADAALDDFGRAWEAGTVREGKDASGIMDKAHRAPVVIAVIERPHLDNRKVVEEEEHYATGAAMQNMLLAAHDAGLGAMLRTGPAAQMHEVKDLLGVADDEYIAGLLYVGYPAEDSEERPMTRRKPAEELTEWRGIAQPGESGSRGGADE